MRSATFSLRSGVVFLHPFARGECGYAILESKSGSSTSGWIRGCDESPSHGRILPVWHPIFLPSFGAFSSLPILFVLSYEYLSILCYRGLQLSLSFSLLAVVSILSSGISKGSDHQTLIGSRHVKATVPTATSHWANSQTCCMQDERLCLPLIPSFDVPFEHKKLICSFDFNSQLPQQKSILLQAW